MSASTLSISFSPPLLVDAQWPMSNVEWYGAEYDFRTGTVSKVSLVNCDTFATGGAMGATEGKVREFILGAVAGTKVGAGAYNPMTDPDPMGSLHAIQANLSKTGGSAPPPVAMGDVSHVTPMATIATRQEVVQGTEKGGIRIPAGTALEILVELGGSAQDLMTGGVQRVTQVMLDTQGIELTSKGAPIAKLQQLVIANGGQVTVNRFEALGALRDAETSETGLRALVQLAQIALMREGHPAGPLVTNMNPDVIDSVATSELNKALTSALHSVIESNATAIPGVNLMSVLGVH
jgi:hypothetical protein